MQYVEDQYRNGGIIVPLLSNDAYPGGHNAPGQPAPVDIYGHDGYPLGFDCANPYTWPDNALPTNWHILHEEQSPTTPYSITEFQGGSFDPWGGLGFAQCEILLNEQFERVFYKNDFSFGVTIFNIYMTFGGTNWGNLGHPGGYTSCKSSTNCNSTSTYLVQMIMVRSSLKIVCSLARSTVKRSLKPTFCKHHQHTMSRIREMLLVDLIPETRT